MRLPRTHADLVLLAVGAVLLALGGTATALGLASRGWPTTEATIESSQVVSRPRHVDPEVRFRYGVEGQGYTSERIRFWFLPRLASWEAEHWVGRFPAGARERVAYSPARPGLAVLAPGVDLDGLVWPAAGLAMVIAAAVPSRAERVGRTRGAASRARSTRRIVGLAGLGTLAWGIHDAEQAWASAKWPRTTATVIHSASYGVSGGTVVSMWFEYPVGGVRFVSDQVRIGGNVTPSREDALRTVQIHPVGSTVEVAYDPDRPERAVLEPGLDWRHGVLPLVALVVLAGVALASAAATAVERRNAAESSAVERRPAPPHAPSGDHAGHSGG
ncbi:MAG: DUF3592 domain-containing protein [Deltaproteobacteria bacterium]|nr:DUF3592 domain-containing protein [Deltaproteobacteria bacterium]